MNRLLLLLPILLLNTINATTVEEIILLIDEGLGMRQAAFQKRVEQDFGGDAEYNKREKEYKITINGDVFFLKIESDKNIIAGLGLRSANFPFATFEDEMPTSWSILNEVYQGVLAGRGSMPLADDSKANFPTYEEIHQEKNPNSNVLASTVVRRHTQIQETQVRLVVWQHFNHNYFTPLFAIYEPGGRRCEYFNFE